jgi:hypothetical protein
MVRFGLVGVTLSNAWGAQKCVGNTTQFADWQHQ